MICAIVGIWNIYNQNVVTPKLISLLSVSNKISPVFHNPLGGRNCISCFHAG